ncbi:MAG: hypothetical protein KJ058_00510 [Thermoanaerobaculia bacterium]|nr:hypothetical protein [Thermoanaerobaculia bacterium]
MAWVRLDDHIDEHPKIAAAGPLGLALFVTSLAYANRNLTDGFVPQSVATRLVAWQAPWGTLAVTTGMEGEDVTSEPVIESLVSLGLWRRVKGGYRIHDFGDFQPSKAQVLAEREAARKRMRKHRNSRGSPEHPPNFAGTSPEVQECSPEVRGPRTRTQDSSGSTDVDPSSSERASAQEHDDDFEGTEPPDPPADLAHALDNLNPTPNQRARWLLAASTEPDRTRACLTAATRAQKPAAYLDQLIRKGDWPTPQTSRPRPDDPPPTPEQKRAALLRSLQVWVTCPEALEYPEPAIRDELDRKARRADTTLTPAEEHDLLTAWAAAQPAHPVTAGDTP